MGWLGDGSDIAVIPAATALDLMEQGTQIPLVPEHRNATGVVVFVHVPPAPARGLKLAFTCLEATSVVA